MIIKYRARKRAQINWVKMVHITARIKFSLTKFDRNISNSVYSKYEPTIRKWRNIMNSYSNKDFYLSSFLIASGEELRSYTRTNGITTFVFNETERLENLVNKYYSMNAAVEPMKFGAAIKNLKSVIHSANTNSNSNNNNERKSKCI